VLRLKGHTTDDDDVCTRVISLIRCIYANDLKGFRVQKSIKKRTLCELSNESLIRTQESIKRELTVSVNEARLEECRE